MSKVTNKKNPINYDWWKEDEENPQETTETSEIPESVVVDMPKEETKDDTTTVNPPSYKRPIHETVVEENPDEELLKRMQMSADLSKFATGLQWDNIHNTLRNAGVIPVSAKIAEDRLKGDKEVGDYLTQIGMPVDEEGYLDMTYKPTEKGWGKKIYDEYIKKGYLEAERDANGNIVNLRRNREASVAPFIEEAVRNIPLPKSFTAGSQSKYFSDITQSVIAQMPKDENGRILYNGQYFPFEEVYTGLYPAIAQKVHEDMLDSNKEYFDANFLRATGQTYEDWYRDYASKRVDEMEVRIGELRDAVAADAEKAAYAKGREVAMSSATLVPASVLGWASGKGAAAESKKMFDDALEEINNFRKNNFGSGFQESFDTLGFLTFGLADLGSTYTQMQLLEKARRGDTLSDTEKNVLELLNIQQEFATIKENLGWEASLGSKIGSGVGATVELLGPFGGAMMGTSMVGNVVKLSTGVAKGAFKANVKAVGKNILNNTLVGYMRGAIAAPLMPNTYAEYTKALKSQYKFNEDGSISFTPTNKRLAYMSAYIDGMNEIASEVYGSTIGELIGYGARTFGRVAKLNKVVDALYTPLSKKADDVLSKVGDTPKAMAFRRAVSNFVDPMKGLDPETRELLRVAGVQDGIFAEATSEVAGDFMATVMKDMVGAEVNYDDYHDKDFWLMQLAVAGLYGGTMSTIGKAGEAVSTYDYIAGVGEQTRRIIDSIESAELRDMLLAITADGNIDRAYIKLAGIDWSAYHPTDKDKAASYVRGSYVLQAAMGSVQEDTRAKAFAVEAQKLTNNAYRGTDISTPVGNDATIMVAESEGRRYYVIAGVPADKSDTSMLTCVDMETGEQKAILSSKANVTSIEGVNDLLEQRYTELFSAQVEAERIESIKSAYGQMERPTAEIAKSLMAQCGIIPPKEGDVVTLADGRSVEVMQDLEDGTYVVRLQDKVPLLFTVPFYNLKSNDTLTAAAQELMLEGKVENATREAVEVAEKAVENGAEVATTEAPSAQSNTAEQRFSIKEAEVASETQTTIEAQEADVANAVEEMESIPTTEDGEVDYDAIKSPKTFAKTYVKEAGSVKQAHTEVKEMRAAAEKELQKIVERGGKEYTASKKRAAAREQRAIQERIAFYDAVAREMELLDTKTEAEFSNIIENEYSVQVSAPVKKIVDGLAKLLGLRVRFVEDADGQNAYILGNEVVISYRNRQKSIAFLIGHEFTHRMQDASPKQYAKFKSMVREAIGEERWNSLVENLKKEYAKQGKSITDTQLEDEVAADAAGELVENRDVFIEHLQHKASDVGFLGFLRMIFRGLANTLRRIGATDREKTILDIVSQLDYLIDSAARNVAKATAQDDARYSARITPEMDASYLDAVERGDMETAQKMVMEAAKLAMPNTKVVDEDGNPKVVYHQTNATVYINRETGQNWDELDWRERMEWDERDDWDDYWEEQEFNTFSRVNARTTNEFDGFFFAPEYDEYHEYGDRTIEAFLNIENPASREDYNIDSSKNNAGRDERIRLQNEGYDGVIREEDGTIWEYVAFSPNQIKSADPVTYDDNGNVIPLSERFNPEKEDIRYSIMQPTDEEVTFDNFFQSTSAVFEIIPKSEVPQREPDYVSERWDGFGVSSRYWYGEDERGKYIIRESDHWSDYPRGERTREAFEAEPYNKRYTRIASCRWALGVSKEQVTTDKEAYLYGNKMYGKAYLDEFTKWENASASAPTAETQTLTSANGDMVADINEATGQGRFSLRTYREGGRDVLADFLSTRVEDRALTEREASEMMQQMDDIYNLCMTMADEYEPFGKWSEAKVVEDENGNPVFSVIKANGDYAMNLDFSLVCKKRRTLDAVLNEMVKRGMIKGVSQKDTTIAKINEVIRKYGFETACALCFVDARRFQILRTARKFCDLYNEVVDMLIPKNKRYPINEFNFAGRSGVTTQEGSLETIADEELNVEKLRKIGYKVIGKTKEGKDIFAKTVLAKIARHLVEHPEDRKYLVPSDFVSTRGFDHVKQMRPLIMKLYNAKKGTGGPKAAYSDTQYLNDIIRSNWKVENAYAVGGVRLQSFSDYVPRMVFDYIQMVAELAAKELPVHAYTKEPLFAKTFGLTGIKINLSLVPDVVEGGVAAGLDADGNYVWRQGETFPYEEAIALQNAEGYRNNCGTIAVGVSDAHILKMLDDPNIRMVIPYHKSGLPVQVAKMNNVAAFTDYTKIQNTTRKGRSLTKEEAAKVPNYNEFLQKLKDPRKAAAAYVAWCETKGYTPKFAKFAEHPNYYKLLEDFTTLVDNKYVPQSAVTFTFPTEESAFGSLESLIEQGLEEDAVTEGMRDARVGAIVDEVGEVLGVKPDARFSIIGEIGAAKIFEDDTYGSPAVDLEVAREMEAEGKDALSIRLATGWERGADDKWRYEIMDGEYHHPADMSQPVRLRDVLDNPALYEAYPDLADMKVEYKSLDENSNGYYDGKGIVINSEKGQAQNASTLIHEIQHAIQHREGFAQGGNSKSFEEGLDEIEAKLTELKEDVDDLVRSSKGEHLLRRLYIATKALGKMLQINYLNAKKDVIEYDAYQRYRKLAGEVEARNVQARHAMSRHERAWTPIGETEDVARESQEFVYRTATSSSDVPRYSVRREDVDNGNIDNVIESLDTARAELERIIRDKKLTNAEKNAVMRGVKALISQELRDGLSRFTRKNDILRMMDAVNEAKAPNAMLNAVNRAMQSIYGIKYRKEFARMASLTKSKITLGVTNVDPEAFLDRLVREKKITDTEARRVIDNYWKGVNASGVSIAKYVDNDTRQVMEFVNAMMDIEKAKALLTTDMKQTMSLVSPPQDIIRAVRITIENDEIADGKLAEALKDESLKQQIIDITDVLEEYWIALDLYNSISEDMTAEEVNSVMPDVIEHMANANATVEELLRSGKVKLSEERKQRKMQERFLIYDALKDMGVTNAIDGRPIEVTRDQRRKVWYKTKGLAGNTIGVALGSMEYMLRKIGVNAPMGEGRIFNHFAPKLQRAYDKTFMALAECNKALDEKCKSLWEKTYAEMQEMAEKTKIGQTYHERDVYVTQAIYLLAMWEQPDARAALEKKQGMDGALADKIRQALDALDPRWREFSEWVVTEFLPSRREKYNAVHRKIFGTSLGYVPNYFPIKRAGESIHSVVDVSIPEMDALPSTIVGSIVERTKNVLPIDVETSFFEALNDNLTTMEGWAEMVGIIRDFNTLLSNRTVREAMNDIAPNMYYDFKKAAQVATLSYVGKTPDIDKNVGTVLSRMWAGTKISFRLYTAFKQLSSALLFAGYSGDLKFQARLLWRYIGGVGEAPLKMIKGILDGKSVMTESSVAKINIMGNIEWCMENLPSFRQRWESGVAGFEVMKRTLGNKSWKQRTWVNAMDEVVQKVATFGFKPNAFVDAFTVAAGARTIFEHEYERLQKEEGYNEEQARVLAIVKAEMAFNSSQQSSEGLYLAPLQADRSLLASAISTFMNASFAMSRNVTQGVYELIRSASKELAEIEDMTYRRMIAPYKKVIKETIAEERAAGAFADENAEVSRYAELMEAAKAQVLPRVKEIAKKKLRDAKIKAALAVIIYGYGGQFAFQLMAELPTLLFGDDDEEKKQIVKDTAINSLWSAPLSMIPVFNLIPAAAAGYGINLFPAVDELGEDIGKIIKIIAKDGVNIEVAKITARLGLRWGLGMELDTWKNIYLGVESMLEDGVSPEAILKVMNGPESQIRKIIGQRRDDESEKEYIERIMRFYSIAENPMFSEYPDAGKYYEGYEIEGKGINYIKYHGGSPMGMTDRDMQRIDYEMAYRRNIVLRYGGGKEYARHQEIDEKFNEYAKTIGSPENVYWRGYYEPKMENLGEKEWSDLMTLKAEVNGYEKWLQHFTGSDESYYEVVKQVEEMKHKFNETYEQFK